MLHFPAKTCTLGIQAHAHRLHARCSARMFDCCALPAAACECWPAEPHLMPQPPVVAKCCSNPRAHKAKVHYQRGTLVKSRPCWQVVPLPSPAFPPTSPDEHHPDPESLCQSSLFPFPRFSQHSLSPCTPALPLHTPWQIMPRSLQSTSATVPLCWHTCPSSGDDLEWDTDLYSHYLSTGHPWPPPSLPTSDTFPDMQAEMKIYGHYPILVGDNVSLLVPATRGELMPLAARAANTTLVSSRLPRMLLMLLPSSTTTISTPRSLKRYMLRLKHILPMPPTLRCTMK